MAGVAIGYYDFFPVENAENKDDWGRVPTWGTCTVVQSKCDFVPVGQRVYGLIPLSRYLIATPKRSKDSFSWIDSAPHRQKRDVVYNTYIDLAKDALYPGPQLEEAMILIRPLFLTAWLLRQAVIDLKPDVLMITSASSKTGAALGGLMRLQRDRKAEQSPRIIGLTSSGNISYTQSLGYYDEVLEYKHANASGNRLVIVDLAGNLPVLREIQRNLKDRLLKILSVGMTHVADSDMAATFSGEGFDPNYAKPEFFFAPKYAAAVAKRDPKALTETAARDWLEFIPKFPLDVKRCDTVQEVEKVVKDFIHGRVPGSVSWVGSLKPAPGHGKL